MTQTPRDWQKDMEMCEAATKGPWEVVNVGEISIAAGYRQDGDIHKATWIAEMDYDYLNETDEEQAANNATLMAEARTALPYWLQEAKVYKQSYEGTLTAWEAEKARADAAEEREKQLKFVLELEWVAASAKYNSIDKILSTLYPDTPAPAAPTPGITARSIDEWHEDYGDALWWTFPIHEPPYCGSPLDIDWPNYHTHWTPIEIPAAPKEGE